jgi:hypothetical protein
MMQQNPMMQNPMMQNPMMQNPMMQNPMMMQQNPMMMQQNPMMQNPMMQNPMTPAAADTTASCDSFYDAESVAKRYSNPYYSSESFVRNQKQPRRKTEKSGDVRRPDSLDSEIPRIQRSREKNICSPTSKLSRPMDRETISTIVRDAIKKASY